MATELTIKKGRGTPKDSDLVEAELAIDVDLGTLYSKLADGTIAALNEGGDGAGMVISATEPADPITGMQWLESTTAIVWIWDEDKWLELPAGGSGDEYDDTQIQNDINNLQNQIDNLPPATPPYDDTQVKADISANASNISSNSSRISANTSAIATKLDASKIWTGTEAQYNSISKQPDTLYFIV